MSDFEWADLIDQQDRVRTLIDPTSQYALAAAYAMGRSMDDEIIAAVSGNAFGGTDGLPGLVRKGVNTLNRFKPLISGARTGGLSNAIRTGASGSLNNGLANIKVF